MYIQELIVYLIIPLEMTVQNERNCCNLEYCLVGLIQFLNAIHTFKWNLKSNFLLFQKHLM